MADAGAGRPIAAASDTGETRDPLPLGNHPREDVLLNLCDVVDALDPEIQQLDTYVAGGEVATPQLVGAFRALEAYDPATQTWASLPSMPNPRHGIAGAVIGNRLRMT